MDEVRSSHIYFGINTKIEPSIFALPEPLTAFLLPLPLMLFSASSILTRDAEGSKVPLTLFDRLSLVLSGKDTARHKSSILLSTVQAAFVTVAILLICGLIAKRNASETFLERRKARHKREGSVQEMVAKIRHPGSATDIISRIMSILLPLVAASLLGGSKAGLIVLASVVAGGTHLHAIKTSSLRQRVSALFEKRSIAAVLALQISYDMWVSPPDIAPSLLLGYTALVLSLTMFPPPLPSTKRALTIAGPPLLNESTGHIMWTLPSLTSPLTSSVYDANQTILAGAVLLPMAIFGAMFTSLPALSSSSFLFGLLSVLCGVFSTFLSEPSSIRRQGRIGFIVISLSLLLIFSADARSSTDMLAATLPGFLIAGAELDRYLRSHEELAHKHTHENHSHKGHSVFTEFLLQHCEQDGVLHGILIEKDSRRILYFTT
jgi:solute carrier family 30 (zinc transporter), member 5/7